MKLTITLDLTPSVAKVLNDWASVSRTLDLAETSIAAALDGESYQDDNDPLRDIAAMALDELRTIHPALSDIHMQIRSELWKISGGVGKLKET